MTRKRWVLLMVLIALVGMMMASSYTFSIGATARSEVTSPERAGFGYEVYPAVVVKGDGPSLNAPTRMMTLHKRFPAPLDGSVSVGGNSDDWVYDWDRRVRIAPHTSRDVTVVLDGLGAVPGKHRVTFEVKGRAYALDARLEVPGQIIVVTPTPTPPASSPPKTRPPSLPGAEGP